MLVLRLAEHFAERASEWILSGILVTLGISVLLMNHDVWSLPPYHGLAALMPQWLCGALSTAIGLARICALYVNGTRRRSPHLRALGAFLAGFFWLQLTLGLLAAPQWALSAAIVPWLFVAEVWNVYRAARDARLSDMRFRPVEGVVPDARGT